TAVANVTFIARTSQSNYIYVMNDSGNWSYVGMIGGQQQMGIFNWNYRFIMSHEIGHALGLDHEHSRSDRDSYVTILLSNVQSGAEGNFDKDLTTNYGAYDFDSVMHYSKSSFSIAPATLNTIEPLPAYYSWLNLMGQRTHLSALDQAGMALRYGAPVLPTPSPTPSPAPTPTPHPTPSRTPHPTPSPTPPPSPTPSPTPSPSPSPSPSPARISGQIQTWVGDPLAGVLVRTTDGISSATTNTSGVYEMMVPRNWFGFVRPGASGYALNPPQKSYSFLSSDQTLQNYTAYLTSQRILDHLTGRVALTGADGRAADYNQDGVISVGDAVSTRVRALEIGAK
ncbi:MAG: M12 family metallopeptidase, partial [Candidatus Sumerlaeota bacterium]|nr:M12 family metallopeptidase [Candidatus Sumerlaeota bacterium]